MTRYMKTGTTLVGVIAALVVASYGMIHAQAPAQAPTNTPAQAPAPEAATPTRVLEGNYRVTLDFVLADKVTKSDRMEQVRRIEFHPDYVIIFDANDVGRMIPVHSIGQLRWDPS